MKQKEEKSSYHTFTLFALYWFNFIVLLQLFAYSNCLIKSLLVILFESGDYEKKWYIIMGSCCLLLFIVVYCWLLFLFDRLRRSFLLSSVLFYVSLSSSILLSNKTNSLLMIFLTLKKLTTATNKSAYLNINI